jgi:hypothetical protein
MDTKELLKMESALKDAREKLAEELRAKAGNILAELRVIGYDFELVLKSDGKKMGRPRKEKPNGIQVS